LVHGGRVVTGGEPLRIDPERGSEGTGEPPPARVQETHAFVPDTAIGQNRRYCDECGRHVSALVHAK
jgi:hypothetical protein